MIALERDIELETVLVNLGERTDQELREVLDRLYAEERELSYQRRILHGKIDILRTELKERLKKRHESGESIISAKDIKRLSEILASGLKGEGEPEE